MDKKERVVQKTEYPHIVKIEGVLGGDAVIEGTRIAVWHIVGYYYKVGMSVEDILAEWDYLNPATIFSALGYYHDHREEIDRARNDNSYERWLEEHPQNVIADSNISKYLKLTGWCYENSTRLP